MDVSKMQAARKEKLLNKTVGVNGVYKTWKKHIIDGTFCGSEIKEKNAIRWNRHKYNRMTSSKEQEAYEARYNTLVKYCALFTGEKTFIEAPLWVYHFFNEWNEQQKIEKNPEQWANTEEINHIFGIKNEGQ